jgi:Cu+-exporting ATPase
MVITKNTNNFTPEAAAILLQNELYNLPKLLSMAKKANRIVKESFAVSLLYNITAVSLAFAGKMEPVIAAILMPISAITLMLYAWLRTYFLVKKEGKN